MRSRRCGIILAGGASSRLATAGIVPPGGKAGLVLAGRTLLERVCERVGAVVERIVVVAAPGQVLPALAEGVDVVRDSMPGCGPLAGIADGLRAVTRLMPEAAGVVVVSCDVPVVSPQLLGMLCDRIDPPAGRPASWAGEDPPVWVVPEVDGHLQVMVSVVRPAILAPIGGHLAAGRLDPRSLVERLGMDRPGSVLRVPEAELRDIDPDLMSFRDLDTPRDLEELAVFLASTGER